MKESIDLLVINPGDVRQVYQHLSNEFTAIETPAFALILASLARSLGYSVAILDVPAEGIAAEEAARRACEYNANLYAVVVYGFQPSASTQNMPSALKICDNLKKINPENKIFITGTHPASLSTRTLKEGMVDFVCTGDGLATLPRLLEAVKAKDANYGNVPGLCFWDAKSPKLTDPSPLIKDLNAMTTNLAYDLLPMTKYRAHNWHCFDDPDRRSPYASFYTTLGCPYQCSFCCINAPFSGPNYSYGGPTYRMWDPKVVVGWIDKLVLNYGVRNIKIVDEMFVLNKKHVFGICDLLIERGYDLNIWAYSRVDTAKDEFLDKTRKAGVRWYALGIESGSRHVRDGAEKALKNNDIIDVVRKIQAAGIYVGANYIFGLPDDNIETMQETLSMALEINSEYANFYSAMAYPGSPLYAMAKERGYSLPDNPGGPGWIGYSQHAYETLPLPTEFISAADVLRFRDNAFQSYFTNSNYLQMMRAKFGEKTVDHIKKMTSLPPLKRKILR